MENRQPLKISPLHSDFYGITFKEWNGDVARLFSARVENHLRVSDIELILGTRVELIDEAPEQVAMQQREEFGVGASLIASLDLSAEPAPTTASTQLETPKAHHRRSEEPMIVEFVERVVKEAFEQRATDIHFEPFESRVALRYRIDGILEDVPVPGELTELYSAVVSRVKILSQLDIAEKRVPQDGRFSFTLPSGATVDSRVSTVPTPFGESLNIRLLQPMDDFSDLTALGFGGDEVDTLVDVLQRPNGIVLVTGPTGSGKTTTLYSCLHQIDRKRRKILTIEDPIEYRIPGVTQIQVQPQVGLTFATGLRSMLRHDPDVMMVGEIRDPETAMTAVQVAMTGHLVFSTIHTNDAISSPARLSNMGVEPYLVGSSLECVVGQRLVRLLCRDCRQAPREEFEAQSGHASATNIPEVADWERFSWQPRGCDRCRHTGYSGRTAVYEVLCLDGDLRELIADQAPLREIERVAIATGFRGMRASGWDKICSGASTAEEVLRATREGLAS